VGARVIRDPQPSSHKREQYVANSKVIDVADHNRCNRQECQPCCNHQSTVVGNAVGTDTACYGEDDSDSPYGCLLSRL